MKESPDVGHLALGFVTDGVVVVALAGHVVQAAPVEARQLDHQLVGALNSFVLLAGVDEVQQDQEVKVSVHLWKEGSPGRLGAPQPEGRCGRGGWRRFTLNLKDIR